MGAFHLHIPAKGTLEEVFSEIPKAVRSYLKEGFSVLSRVSEAHLEDVVTIAIESIQSGYGVGEFEASKIGVGRDEAKPLLAAVSFLAGMLSSREETPEEFVRLATEKKLLEDGDREVVLGFLRAVAKSRFAFKQAMDQSRLAAGVLPSLAEFETTVDVRLGFDKSQPSYSIPLALVHVDTDAEGQEVWFQLTKRQVRRVIDELQNTLRRMEEAEKWAENSFASKE